MCATRGWQTLGPRRCCCLCPSNRLPLPAMSIQPSYESYGAPIDLGGLEYTVEPPTPDECVVVTPPTPQECVVRPATPQLIYNPLRCVHQSHPYNDVVWIAAFRQHSIFSLSAMIILVFLDVYFVHLLCVYVCCFFFFFNILNAFFYIPEKMHKLFCH